MTQRNRPGDTRAAPKTTHTSTGHSSARNLHDRGLHVFPVDHPRQRECIGRHGPDSPCDGSRGKHPAVKWGTWAVTVTPQMIDLEWGKHRGLANIGVACGPSNLVVLDEDAPGEIDRWCVTHGIRLPDTYIVITGRGRHVYFRWDHTTKRIGNSEKALKGYAINVRGHGGFVVAEGSRHKNRVIYTGNGQPVADLPDEVARLLLAEVSTSTTKSEPQWKTVQDNHTGKIAFHHRHPGLIAYAGRLRNCGLTYAEAELIFHERWLDCEQPEGQIPEARYHSAECEYPCTWDEAKAKLADVFERYSAGKALEEPVPVALLDKLGVTSEWLEAQTFPDLEEIVPGLIVEGVTVLAGPPKVGKSFLVGNIAIAVVSGGKALGNIDVTNRPVLVLALEDGHRRLQSRYRDINEGPIPPGITFITKASPAECAAVIAEYLQRYGHLKPLIVLDTLGKAKPQKRSGQEAYLVDYEVGGRFKALADSWPGSAILIIHHTRKADAADFVDLVSGTQGIAGSVDCIITVARKRKEAEAVLSVTGRDIMENEYAFTVNDGYLWQLDGESLRTASERLDVRRQEAEKVIRAAKLGPDMKKVLTLVNERGNITAEQITFKCKLTPNRVAQITTRLVEGDFIVRTGRGEFHSHAYEAAHPIGSGVSGVFGVNGVSGESDTPHAPDTPLTSDTPLTPPVVTPLSAKRPKYTCRCGAPLTQPKSLETGLCTECRTT